MPKGLRGKYDTIVRIMSHQHLDNGYYEPRLLLTKSSATPATFMSYVSKPPPCDQRKLRYLQRNKVSNQIATEVIQAWAHIRGIKTCLDVNSLIPGLKASIKVEESTETWRKVPVPKATTSFKDLVSSRARDKTQVFLDPGRLS